jgi:hypothetical protein
MVHTKTLRAAAEAMKETGRANPGIRDVFEMAAEHLDRAACEIDRLRYQMRDMRERDRRRRARAA